MKNLKNKITCGETILGIMLSEIATPNIVRIMKIGGLEFLIVDCEHGYFDYSQLANIIALGNGYEISVIVRVPGIERGYITKIMDMGADGLLVPMVNTVQDAEKIVEYAKYSPVGKRGISTTRAHNDYGLHPLNEYLHIANKRTLIFTQIETSTGVKNSGNIAAVNGIDALIVGPNDLASDLGVPGDMQNSILMEAIDEVILNAKKAGKSSGIATTNKNLIKKCKSKGMNIFSYGSELGMLLKAAKNACEEFINI